ncbi:uncharacterized protein LOC114951667 isoform X6 [Acropora millepora]|uniref:uncharacterized protein LOC114951667 isoform X6 n=1 Tax=Acropora millepora TaxID=45264 RepID=UPI001CF45BAB|nr:uncharacterized protein LOC114951667 isoform X6 [Acropora millepora]
MWTGCSSLRGTSVSWPQKATGGFATLVSSRKLKVALFGSEWGSTKGGLSTINRELAIQLAKNDNVEVSMYLPCYSEKDESAAAEFKVCLQIQKPQFESIDWLPMIPRHHCIDVVIGHGSQLGRQVKMIKEFYPDCKWIQVVHTDPEELGMFKDYPDPIVKGEKKHQAEVELCKLADQVVAVGPKLTEAFARYLRSCGKDEDVINLTPGIFSEFANVNQAAKGGETFRVLVFGRGDKEDFHLKGYDIAARAVAKLKEEECRFKLVFVGAPNGEEEKVKDRFLKEGISPSQLIVRSAKDREQLAEEFCQADLVIMPSRTEGFGLAALEALSAGLPVLVSSNSGIGKALKRVPCGPNCVVNNEDPVKWAEAIKAVCRKERKVRLREAVLLRQTYAETYQWEEQCTTLVEKMLEMIKEIKRKGPSHPSVTSTERRQRQNAGILERVDHGTLDQGASLLTSNCLSSAMDSQSRIKESRGKRPLHPLVTTTRERQGQKRDIPEKTSKVPDQAVVAVNLGEQGPSSISEGVVHPNLTAMNQYIVGDVVSSDRENESRGKRLLYPEVTTAPKRQSQNTGIPKNFDESVSFKPGTVSIDDVPLIAHELGPSWKTVGRVLNVPDAGSSVPAEIRGRGPEAERAFQKAMKSGKVKVYRARIMLLGQDRAGKTSLKKSLLGLPFDPKEESTVGVEVDRSKCELEVDEVQNWMPSERKKREMSEFEEELARLIVMDLRGTKANDSDSTATDPNAEEVKITDEVEERKDFEEPKLLSDVVTDTREESMIVEDGQKVFSERKPVDENDSNKLQLNINSTVLPNDVTDLVAKNATDLVVRYLRSLQLEDDIKSKEVILTVWDFAGQHLYYASHSVFLSGRAVYILVYNLNKNLLARAEPCVRQGVIDSSLDNPNNETNLDNLLSWLVSVHNIRSAAKKNVAHQGKKPSYLQPPVIIVGTNLDQPFEEVNTMEECIKKSIVDKKYMKHVTVPFFAIDNKTENDEGVQKLRQRIIEILKEEPYMGEEVPLRWFKFERAVDALVAKQTYFMDLDQLLPVIRQFCQIEDKEEVTAMLNFYHDLGVIVKHGQTVVLQAQWLIDLFKQLITVRPFDEANPSYREHWRDLEVNGILRIALVDHVFSKFMDKGLCKQDILDLMERHGLIAKFSIATDKNQDEQRYFVPTQLRSSPSGLCEIKPSGCDPCPLVLHFLDGFVPHGLFPQLVSKFIHWCSENGLKETPQLFNNGARLFIGKQITFALILICRKRFIKIVLKTRNPSSCKSQSMIASNKMAIEVRNFIERTLDDFSHDFSWLSNLRYELSVVCTYCLECTRHLHERTSCDQDDCLHLLRVRPGEELICLKNFCDETVSPGWEMWFEVPHTQTNEPEEDTQIADGTSSEPETTTQRVKTTKRKRNENFTGMQGGGLKFAACFSGHSSGVPPKRKKGIEKNDTTQPAGLDESVSFKPGTVSEDDVILIAHELCPLWKKIGLVLKVPRAVIDQIEANRSEVSDRCYTVLTEWQKRFPYDATYHRLALALKHPAVGRVDLAAKYCNLTIKDVSVAKDC